MPVMMLNVPRRSWNTVQLTADLHGVQMSPELPTEDSDVTSVQLTGPAWSLLQTFRKTPANVEYKGVVPFADRDPEPEVMP